VDYGSLWKNHSGLARMRSYGLKTKTILRSLNRFFHYEPLSVSSFRKNLSTPEAIHFQKAKLLQILLFQFVFICVHSWFPPTLFLFFSFLSLTHALRVRTITKFPMKKIKLRIPFPLYTL